jgi:hypothetical protein
MVAHSDNVESGSEYDTAANRNGETDFAKSRHESSHKLVDVAWFEIVSHGAD